MVGMESIPVSILIHDEATGDEVFGKDSVVDSALGQLVEIDT